MTVAFAPDVDADALDADVVDLLPRLESADAATRRVALLELADLEDETALPLIEALLRRDPDREVRSEAARVLASWASVSAVDALAQALLDEDEGVRAAAALSLSGCNDVRLGPALTGWLSRPEPFVRATILRALRELRYAPAFDAAYAALDDGAAEVRAEAVGVLGWLRDARAIDALARVTHVDNDESVRRAATAALGMANDAEHRALDALLLALNDASWQVRESAAATLGKIGAQATRDALIGAFEDPYWQVRVQAARSLGRLRDPAAIDVLSQALGHGISNLRKEAALALGEIGDAAAVPALETATSDPDPDVRKAARIALAQIGSGHAIKSQR